MESLTSALTTSSHCHPRIHLGPSSAHAITTHFSGACEWQALFCVPTGTSFYTSQPHGCETFLAAHFTNEEYPKSSALSTSKSQEVGSRASQPGWAAR